MSFAPNLEHSIAVERPIPDDAPVTKIVLDSNVNGYTFFLVLTSSNKSAIVSALLISFADISTPTHHLSYQ